MPRPMSPMEMRATVARGGVMALDCYWWKVVKNVGGSSIVEVQLIKQEFSVGRFPLQGRMSVGRCRRHGR